jgi:predicted nucleotide-binding protein
VGQGKIVATAKKRAATKSSIPAKRQTAKKSDEKRVYFRQSDFPQTSLQQAQKLAAALVDNFAGDSASPPDVAFAIGNSPTSSVWQSLAGASIAYGLTDGGVNASMMKLTSLGKRLVAPEEEGDDVAARREAILKPRILREFFEKYRRAKLPNEVIAVNVLKSLGLPVDRAKTAFEIIKSNGQYAGIIREGPTGFFVNLDSPGIPTPAATVEISEQELERTEEDATPTARQNLSPNSSMPVKPSAAPSPDPKGNRVFITHGKQRAIVGQIKELLTFGNFEPIVSVEREATAIPVPEKVFEDMRSCSAGVLHVGAEGKYLDRDGNEHVKINDNVLIEIGAAMALYGKRVILLVEKGVVLPSNLQGLYRCEFEGDKLDYDSTMKLLKTFSQFR